VTQTETEIFAIDPGPTQSAFVWRKGAETISFGIESQD
jgi:hypothetical protein